MEGVLVKRDSAQNQQTSVSPFQYTGLTQQTQQHKQEQSTPSVQPPENNRSRSFRRYGNICEIAGGASLNSAVIFTFHLLQVHPIGVLLAVVTAHFYFTATTAGEPEARRAHLKAMQGLRLHL
jgi:hypothetical protein